MTPIERAEQTLAYLESPNSCSLSKPRQALLARSLRAVIEASKEENDYEPRSNEYWLNILRGEL